MESAGKARNNGLYRHIRTSKDLLIKVKSQNKKIR